MLIELDFTPVDIVKCGQICEIIEFDDMCHIDLNLGDGADYE